MAVPVSPVIAWRPGRSTGFHRHEFGLRGRSRRSWTHAHTRKVKRFSDLSPGVAYFRPAEIEHDVFNGGEEELIFVEIEFVR